MLLENVIMKFLKLVVHAIALRNFVSVRDVISCSARISASQLRKKYPVFVIHSVGDRIWSLAFSVGFSVCINPMGSSFMKNML